MAVQDESRVLVVHGEGGDIGEVGAGGDLAQAAVAEEAAETAVEEAETAGAEGRFYRACSRTRCANRSSTTR